MTHRRATPAIGNRRRTEPPPGSAATGPMPYRAAAGLPRRQPVRAAAAKTNGGRSLADLRRRRRRPVQRGLRHRRAEQGQAGPGRPRVGDRRPGPLGAVGGAASPRWPCLLFAIGKDTVTATDVKVGDCLTDIPDSTRVLTRRHRRLQRTARRRGVRGAHHARRRLPGPVRDRRVAEQVRPELATFSPDAMTDDSVGSSCCTRRPRRGSRATAR